MEADQPEMEQVIKALPLEERVPVVVLKKYLD